MDRKRLGLICFCFILLKIQRRDRGFSYTRDGVGLHRYIAGAHYLRRRFPAHILVAFANTALRYAETLATRENVLAYLAERLSGKAEIVNAINFSDDDWRELSIAWLKYYVLMQKIQLSDIPEQAVNTSRVLGITKKETNEVIRTLLAELLNELLPA